MNNRGPDTEGIASMPVKPTPPHERIMSRVTISEQGCWEFQGALNHSGYGIIQMGRGIGTDRTHRVMYRHHVGEIPDGLTLDHLCANPACCNPDHLEPVTRAENTRRQWADGRADPGRSRRERTHCPQGHPYDEANTLRSNGRRHCRACARDKERRRRERLKESK